MLITVLDNLDILYLHLYNNTILKKRGVRMLSKPQHGWTDFSLGENCYSISYLSNVPFDWLDRAIFGMETLLPFEVYGCCEPGRIVCAVDFSECRIFFENDKHQKDDSSCEAIPMNMLDFCQKLHKDISDHIDDWQKWGYSYNVTKEDLQSRLDRLQKLINVKANCFI